MDNLQIFQEFFDCCVGQWISERTYHYLSHGDIERSQTTFQIDPISSQQKAQVLNDNQFPVPEQLETLPGFHLVFHTVSDKGEVVDQSLNLLFVPNSAPLSTSSLEGKYLRDRAYEESRPIVSDFQFHPLTRELQMTTLYTRVVSVDSITLVNPQLRIRKILNYQRPGAGEALTSVQLVGFGVEQKL